MISGDFNKIIIIIIIQLLHVHLTESGGLRDVIMIIFIVNII